MQFNKEISVEVVDTVKGLFEIEPVWNRLFQDINCDIPYLSFNWYKSAILNLGDQHPYVLVIRDGSKVIAVVPLVAHSKKCFGYRRRTLTFVRPEYTPYQDILTQSKYSDIVVETVLRHVNYTFGKAVQLHLEEMRQSGVLGSKAIADIARREKCFFGIEDVSKSRFLQLGTDFSVTLSKLSSRRCKEFRRKMKRLEKVGPIDLEVLGDAEKIKNKLDLFFKVYKRTWKGAEKHPQFYRDIVKYADDVRFYTLYVSDVPVAFLLTLIGGNIAYGIKLTYDPNYYAFSPGVLLIYKVIENLHLEGGIEEFDIGRGDEQFKREWTQETHDQHIAWFAPYGLYNWVYFLFRFRVLPFVRTRRTLARLKLMVISNLKKLMGMSQQFANTVRTCFATRAFPKVIEVKNSEMFLYHLDDKLEPQSQGITQQVHEISRDDSEKLAVAMAARNFKIITDRLQNGDRCLGVTNGKSDFGYLWISPKLTLLQQYFLRGIKNGNVISLYDAGVKSQNGFAVDCGSADQVIIQLKRMGYDSLLLEGELLNIEPIPSILEEGGCKRLGYVRTFYLLNRKLFSIRHVNHELS